jgi:hypothetical protein
MRPRSAYLFGIGLALPMLALVAGLQVPTVAASPQDPTTQDPTTTVNRSLKGDRLPRSLPATTANPPHLEGRQAPQTSPKLPDGCEATVSVMTQSLLAQTAGRCIS